VNRRLVERTAAGPSVRGARWVYGREHVALVSAEESARLDRVAREEWGVPERVLMENAGRAAALVISRLFGRGRVVAAVGGGNNGGDALVALRALATWGREVAYVAASEREPDAALLHGHGLKRLSGDPAVAFAEADVIVDGILGTGASGAPRARAAAVIEAMNGSGRPIVALDLPSGVDGTTGAVPGAAVNAVVTVTFGWPKRGLLLNPGRQHCGRIVAVEIGFPPPAGPSGAELITPAWCAARLRPRGPAAHKGSVGRVLVLAGSRGMAGAAVLSARSAQRAGAGLVRVASDEANRHILQTAVPEAVFVDRTDGAALAEAVVGVEAVVAGPGLGKDASARSALEAVLEAGAGLPTLLDADALTLLAREPGRLSELAAGRPVVLTPHPGEMSRLTGKAPGEIVAAPLEVARELAEETGCVVLLKGSPSVVAAPGEPVLVNTVGSSDLATAGMGDQLASAIGAMLAAGSPAREAAALGLFYSGRASELASRGRSLSPLDVAEHLARAFADPGPQSSPLGLPFVIFDQPPRW